MIQVLNILSEFFDCPYQPWSMVSITGDSSFYTSSPNSAGRKRGTYIFRRSDHRSCQTGTYLNGFWKSFSVCQSAGNTCTEGITCTSGIFYRYILRRAEPPQSFAVRIDRAFSTHSNNHRRNVAVFRQSARIS